MSACLPGAARAQDSLRVIAEFGLTSDYTNQIYFEQTFDSTAVTGRLSVADPRARVVAEAITRLFGASGRWTLDASNVFGVGPTVLRDAGRVAAGAALSPALKARVEGEVDARRDDTFDSRREDRRAAGRTSLLWTSADHATGARLFGRIEGLRSSAGTLALFPDYDYKQVGLDLDRFGLAGHATASYAYGTRAFPDTSVRNYREHTLALDARWQLANPVRIEIDALGERRRAPRDSALGDRFVSTDSELRLLVTRGEHFEWGGLARARGQVYDAPTPTFFNAWIWRYALIARVIPEPLSRIEFRPEIELLRTPRFGGVPAGTGAGDLAAVANEEYDQLGLVAEAERLGEGAWWWGTLSGGHRRYLDDGADPSDLSARSSFWYAEVSAYAERRLGAGLRLRASADGRFEFHRATTDNLATLDLTLGLRVRL
ncbi:MAG: hypothetical protein ABI960_03580 [Candidatus Eisenbacteria bacterium]